MHADDSNDMDGDTGHRKAAHVDEGAAYLNSNAGSKSALANGVSGYMDIESGHVYDQHTKSNSHNAAVDDKGHTEFRHVDGQMHSAQPMQILYQGLKFTVKVQEQHTTRRGLCGKKSTLVNKDILQGLTGIIQPGRLTAVMGASGAGKTTLLNVLAGHMRTQQATVSGVIKVNGEVVTGDKMHQVSGFVHQEDVILDTMTVREALLFAAHLRLPKDVPAAEKEQRALAVADMLNLTKALDACVGSSLIQGISGGEKRRLGIGMEMITNPSILFLDEPTSGLDTYNAFKVARIMRTLAHSYSRTVVATIHQPSSDIFQQFDDLIILTEGEVIYHGPAAALVAYFDTLGYVCPTYTNPADFLFMDVLHAEQKESANTLSDMDLSSFTGPQQSTTTGTTAGAAAAAVALDREQQRLNQLVQSWHQYQQKAADSAAAQQQHSQNKDVEGVPGGGAGGKHIGGGISASAIHKMAPVWVQLRLLARRAMLHAWRNKLMIKGKLAQTLFLHIIVGLIYLRIGNDQAGVQGRQGSLFFLCVQGVFGTVMSTLTVFGTEKAVFQREYSSRMYSLPAYFWSRWLTQLPMNILMPLLGSVIVYFMVGYQPVFEKFLWFALVKVLLDNCGASLGIFVSCIFNDIAIAMNVMPMVILPLMVFSGFFVNANAIPPYFNWIQYLSPMRYGFIALIKNEFSGLSIDCGPPQQAAMTNCNPSGDAVIAQLGFNDKGTIGGNAAVLFGLAVGFLLIAHVALWLSVRKMNK